MTKGLTVTYLFLHYLLLSHSSSWVEVSLVCVSIQFSASRSVLVVKKRIQSHMTMNIYNRTLGNCILYNTSTTYYIRQLNNTTATRLYVYDPTGHNNHVLNHIIVFKLQNTLHAKDILHPHQLYNTSDRFSVKHLPFISCSSVMFICTS